MKTTTLLKLNDENPLSLQTVWFYVWLVRFVKTRNQMRIFWRKKAAPRQKREKSKDV